MTDRELLKEARDRLHGFAEPFPTNWSTPEAIFALLDRIDAALAAPVSHEVVAWMRDDRRAVYTPAQKYALSERYGIAGARQAARYSIPLYDTPVSTGPLVTVPREPTPAMIDAGSATPLCKAIDDCLTNHAIAAAPPAGDDARDAWVSVDDRRPPTRDGGDDVPVWTWDGESVKEDFFLEMHEQPIGHGGWVSIGWGFLADGGGRNATHWMPRPTPAPPAMRAQGESK